MIKEVYKIHIGEYKPLFSDFVIGYLYTYRGSILIQQSCFDHNPINILFSKYYCNWISFLTKF